MTANVHLNRYLGLDITHQEGEKEGKEGRGCTPGRNVEISRVLRLNH